VLQYNTHAMVVL